MKILVLTRYARLGASSRLRFYQYIESGSLTDIEWVICPLLGDEYVQALYRKERVSIIYLLRCYFLRLCCLFRARNFDLLWIEKELFPALPAFFERMISIFGIRYIVDYDDATFHSYDQSNQPLKRFLRNKIDMVMRHSTLVTAGNRYLADRAIAAGARSVELLPTVIDLDRYLMTENSNERLIIGWIGSPATVKFLDIVLPVLDQLAKKIDFELMIIGAVIDKTERDYVRLVQWTEKTEVSNIACFDIGIMPLLDAPFERGKCGYKLIQYMACGVPVIASPVGVNCEIVDHAINGFLAGDRTQWLSAFESLAADSLLRKHMGLAGRKLIEQKYCLQKTAPILKDIFKSTLD